MSHPGTKGKAFGQECWTGPWALCSAAHSTEHTVAFLEA